MKFRPPRERAVGKQPQQLFLHFWEKLQILLSEILRTNLSLFDLNGHCMLSPSQATAFCDEFTNSHPFECVLNALSTIRKRDQREIFVRCDHGLHFMTFSIAMTPGGEMDAVLIFGPYLVGERDSEKNYREICRQKKWNPEIFCDLIREIRVFSTEGLDTAQSFIHALLEAWNSKEQDLSPEPATKTPF